MIIVGVFVTAGAERIPNLLRLSWTEAETSVLAEARGSRGGFFGPTVLPFPLWATVDAEI